MYKDYKIYLADILEAVNNIRDYTNGLTFRDFASDRKTIDAVNRNFGIIGEAANRIPYEVKNKYPNIKWHRIIALRNIIIHDYTSIDLEIIWDIIKNRLSLFEKQIEEIYQE